jgi:pyridoxal phosphate enzyme (YggS family)
MSAPSDDHRRAELLASLARVRARLVDAARSAGREPRDITLIAVTKTFPTSDARALLDLGVRDLGESRDQDARLKADELGGQSVRWHFVGRIQTNKARSIAKYATAVHSIDRPEVVDALAAAVERQDRAPLDVFVQLSIDGDSTRGGTSDLDRLADLIGSRPSLRLRGVMAVAPMGMEPAAAFARVAQASQQLIHHHPQASAISAGMSGDFEAAIAAGSTHLRVGSALLGRRTPDFG